jgi:hypothetical protein
MMNDQVQTSIPRNPAGEHGLITTKALLSLLPFAGGAASELLSGIVTPILERRKNEWLESLAIRLSELISTVAELTPDKLFQGEEFTSAFIRASRIALGTQQSEKLDALRNAVLNVAAGMAPDENLQLMFLDALDSLTPWHLKLLDCVADPMAWSNRHEYPIHDPSPLDAGVFFEAYYRDQLPVEGFVQQLLEDLYGRGLVANNVKPRRGQITFHDEKDAYPFITKLGQQFLAFVTAPNL